MDGAAAVGLLIIPGNARLFGYTQLADTFPTDWTKLAASSAAAPASCRERREASSVAVSLVFNIQASCGSTPRAVSERACLLFGGGDMMAPAVGCVVGYFNVPERSEKG